ncbi:hypothetical protein [Hydrogenimonas sp.]
MKKLVLILTAALWLFGAAAHDEMAEKVRQQNMAVVKAAAESLSRELPKQVDAYTKLVKIDADGERLVYHFEVDAGPVSDEALKKRKASRTRVVTQGVCGSYERFLKSGIVIVYRYISAVTKKPLFDVVVRKDDCPMLRE